MQNCPLSLTDEVVAYAHQCQSKTWHGLIGFPDQGWTRYWRGGFPNAPRFSSGKGSTSFLKKAAPFE